MRHDFKGLFGALLLAGCAAVCAPAAWATPQRGTDCKACHGSSKYLPPAHPKVEKLGSAQCTTCHLATQSQDRVQDRQTVQEQARDRDRDRDREQDRKREQDRRQVRLGGDPWSNPLAGNTAAKHRDEGHRIERYLERERAVEDESGNGRGAQDHAPQNHDFNHSETQMEEAANRWSYRAQLGYLYSSDIEQHLSGSHLGGGGSHGGDHGDDHDAGGDVGGDVGGDDSGEGVNGAFIRLGGAAEYTRYLGGDRTLTYGLALNRDQFPALDQVRWVGRAKLDWKWKLADGSLKLSPYLQRSYYDIEDADNRAFWALGLNVNRHVTLADGRAASLTFRYKQRRFDGEDDFRRPDLRFGASFQGKVGEKARYQLGLGLFSRANPKKDENRYFGEILTAGIGGPLDNGATAWLTAELGHRGYRGPDATGVTRDDKFLGLGMSYSDPRLTLMGTVPYMSCLVRWTQSNVAAYDDRSGYCAFVMEKRF